MREHSCWHVVLLSRKCRLSLSSSSVAVFWVRCYYSNLLTDDGIWNIACAFFDKDENFDERAVGNAQNVVSMLETRNSKMPELGNLSLEDYYTNFLGKIAAGGSNAQALVDTQTDVVDAIKDQIHSNNSVDLNEELVDLVKYQTAYSAAAQVFNTCNSCLNTLMTLGG